MAQFTSALILMALILLSVLGQVCQIKFGWYKHNPLIAYMSITNETIFKNFVLFETKGYTVFEDVRCGFTTILSMSKRRLINLLKFKLQMGLDGKETGMIYPITDEAWRNSCTTETLSTIIRIFLKTHLFYPFWVSIHT